MRLKSRQIGTWGIFEVDGTVDSIHTRVFIDALADYANSGHKNVIIDLSKAPFLSIGAIRYMNQVCQHLEKVGGRMAILGANERIRRHIDIFVSWKLLKEINGISEVVPYHLASKYNEVTSFLIVDSMDSSADKAQEQIEK